MGSDFMLWVCEYPWDIVAAKPIIENRIKLLSNETLDSIARDYLFYNAEEIERDMLIADNLVEAELFGLDELFQLRVRDMVRNEIREAVTELLDEDRRDIQCMILNDYQYAFTGGLSNGDIPTEACDYFSIIDYSGVLDGLGKRKLDYSTLM